MKLSLRVLTRVLCVMLGVFEFYSAYDFSNNFSERVDREQLLPPSFKDPGVVSLFIAYIITLGILRLNWALGQGGFTEWLALVGAHVIEARFWWNLAYSSNLVGGDTISAFSYKVITLEFGLETRVLLFAVPVLILLFVLTGPFAFDDSKRPIAEQLDLNNEEMIYDYNKPKTS